MKTTTTQMASVNTHGRRTGWTRTGVEVERSGRGLPAPAWDAGQGWTSVGQRPVALIDVSEDEIHRPGMVLLMKAVITATMLAVSAMAGAWVGQLS